MTREGSSFSNTRRAATPSIRTRIAALVSTVFTGSSIQILPVRPNRIKATLYVSTGTVLIADDISTLIRGEGARINPDVPVIIEGGGQVWAQADISSISVITTAAGDRLQWRSSDGTNGLILVDDEAGVNVTITEVLSGVGVTV